MIATTETLLVLDRMRADAGVDKSRPDASLAWQVFKAFSAVSVAAARDSLLFQCGTYDFSGELAFELNFTRQLTQEEDGDYVGMEQLGCTLYFAPVDELRFLTTDLWSFGYASSADFFAAVEELPAFCAVVTRHIALRAVTRQEVV